MKTFEYQEHTADIYLIGYGKDFKEALQNTAQALNNFQVPLEEVKSKITRKVSAQSEDRKSLIVDFLSELLILHDAENLVFKSTKITKLQETKQGLKLEATLKGEEFDSKRHHAGQHVKAITYHNMAIEKTKQGLKVRVLIDI